eukprot:5322241-Amphidinium_carterae.1
MKSNELTGRACAFLTALLQCHGDLLLQANLAYFELRDHSNVASVLTWQALAKDHSTLHRLWYARATSIKAASTRIKNKVSQCQVMTTWSAQTTQTYQLLSRGNFHGGASKQLASSQRLRC